MRKSECIVIVRGEAQYYKMIMVMAFLNIIKRAPLNQDDNPVTADRTAIFLLSLAYPQFGRQPIHSYSDKRNHEQRILF